METYLISVVTEVRLMKCETLYLAKTAFVLLHADVIKKPRFVLYILNLYDFSNWNIFLSSSQQPFPERLRIRVSRISMHDYEALHYDKEKLKEACEYETYS